MTEAEIHHIHFLERQTVSEAQVSLAVKSGMHVGQTIAGVALTVHKDYLCLRVIQKQAAQLSGCVSGTANDAYSDGIVHLVSLGFSGMTTKVSAPHSHFLVLVVGIINAKRC